MATTSKASESVATEPTEPEEYMYTTVGRRPLTEGSRGDDVKNLQDRLNVYGADLKIDGEYGPVTGTAANKLLKQYRDHANSLTENVRTGLDHHLVAEGSDDFRSLCGILSIQQGY